MNTDSKSKVIQLNQFGELDDFPAYVAIYSKNKIDNPFVLSPVAMQWTGQIILNRVKDCETFWKSQQHKQQSDIETMFSMVLSYHYGDDFIAVFGCHPWQCLLYLSYQCQQQSSGIYFLQSRLNQNVYRRLDWSFWFENQDDLSRHLQAINAKGFNPVSFRARQSRLKAFIHRIGLNGPFELKAADYQSFSRRFETWLGNIWRWTMTRDCDLQGFPWIAAQQTDNPSVMRDLEYPVNVWQVVEQLLREDLLRLCERFAQNDTEHVNRMLWQIRLFNQQLIDIELNFCFPYSLHRDQPNFTTALYQARYVYDDLMRKLQVRDHDLDLPDTMPFIAWRVELCERFSLPPVIWDLFDSDDGELSHQDLFNLQNKLPVPIESYAYASSFFPDQSFQLLPLSHRPDKSWNPPQWATQSINRPLFYYPSVQEIDKPPAGEFIFLERSVCAWWQQQDCQAIKRDYFRLQDATGRWSWIYRDFNGAWFKQGEYC